MTEDQIRDAFYHPSNPTQCARFETIRETIIEATVKIAGLIPDSRERSLFITDMQRAQMMANAAVAIHGPRQE